MFSSIWLEKKHNNKVLIELCGGKVCSFSRYPNTCSMAKLSQQHFCPLLAHGYCGHIPSPLSTMTTRKNDESIEHLQCKKEKAKKASPSSDVYMFFFFFFSLYSTMFS
jgi:hypothetical protein